MTDPTTKAGKWLVDRSNWDGGMRGFFIRINATGGPEDMRNHVLAIEAEARASLDAQLTEAVDLLRQAHARVERLYDAMRAVEDHGKPLEATDYLAVAATYAALASEDQHFIERLGHAPVTTGVRLVKGKTGSLRTEPRKEHE